MLSENRSFPSKHYLSLINKIGYRQSITIILKGLCASLQEHPKIRLKQNFIIIPHDIYCV